MTTTAIETKVVCLCASCLCAKPTSQFRRRLKGDPRRQRTCRECHTAVERKRRAFHRSQQDQTIVRRFVCDVKAADSSQRIGMLVTLVERELGGPQELADAWMAHFHAACRKNGGRKILDVFAAIMRLSVACAELRPKPDFDAMNDAELREARDQLLAEYLNEHVPMLLETLIDQGWTIVPPSNSEDAPNESNEASTTAQSLV